MKCVFPDEFVKRFQEWEPRLGKEDLIWVTFALAVNVALRREFDEVVSQVRRKLQQEMGKIDSLQPDDV